MTWPKFWDLSGEAGELVWKLEDTSMVTIYNIDVITSYLQKQEFLMPDGEVRPVLLSEMGFTSTYGRMCRRRPLPMLLYCGNNQYIDAMIYPEKQMRPRRWPRGWPWDFPTRTGAGNTYMILLNILIPGRRMLTRNLQEIILGSRAGTR